MQDNIKSLLAQKLSEKTHKNIKDSQQLVDLFFELILDKNQIEEIKNLSSTLNVKDEKRLKVIEYLASLFGILGIIFIALKFVIYGLISWLVAEVFFVIYGFIRKQYAFLTMSFISIVFEIAGIINWIRK